MKITLYLQDDTILIGVCTVRDTAKQYGEKAISVNQAALNVIKHSGMRLEPDGHIKWIFRKKRGAEQWLNT